jgi:tRNA dimethylallyltransferase
MLKEGFLDEVKWLGEKYGFDSEAMTGIGYRAFKDVVLGTKLISDATEEFAQGDIHYAKRQMTWFKRNKDIHWIESPEQANDLVKAFLGV